MAPSHLTLSEVERSKSWSPRFGSVIDVSHKGVTVLTYICYY